MDSNLQRSSSREAPSHLRHVPAPPPADDLDDLFDYDAGVNDVFREVDTNMNVPANDQPRPGKRGVETSAGLGIDQEIKVSRKRKPIAKLDEARLLSQGGIPKLRRVAKERLKFKGKGHEYKDLSRLLNFYQLWLDDLYPRAKFADALCIIEKLGHTKRMQIMRREWINEWKPESSCVEGTDADQNISTGNIPSQGVASNGDRRGRRAEFPTSADRPTTPRTQQRSRTPPRGILEADDDLYSATPGAVRQTNPLPQQRDLMDHSLFVTEDETGAQPEEDELDMLLAEDAAQDDHRQTGRAQDHESRAVESPVANDFDDEMEVMAVLCMKSGVCAMLLDLDKKCPQVQRRVDTPKVPSVEDKLSNRRRLGRSILTSLALLMAHLPGYHHTRKHHENEWNNDHLEDSAWSVTEMTQDLSATLRGLHVRDVADAEHDGGFIDPILEERRPRKRARKSGNDVKKELEQDFLTPSPVFGPDWLNKLQHRWDTPTDYTGLFDLAPTQTRTITRFLREGLEGRVTGYKEVTVPASSATAKNSTSLLRKPANRAEFVRGAAGFFPFAPGGLDGVEAAAALENEAIKAEERVKGVKRGALDRVINFGSEGGLLEIPPGFTRGLNFEKTSSKVNETDAHEVEIALGEEPEESVLIDGDTNAQSNGVEGHEGSNGHLSSGDEEEDIDSLLPVEYPALEPRAPLALSTSKRGGREWAHMVDINRDITNFHELVPDMAKDWPFELDTFQKEAVYHLENGDSVFVAAHTSAGKTVVAEYAIALAAKHMTKAIYTSPIKALSNQKFRDFRHTFDDVGILTGDVQIRPEASCLIMTTEILRSMLYRGADLIRDVEFVIFDEVHYVNDLERGVVWEEVIIMLPEHVTLILLSATVPNTYEFASWVGRTKKKDIYVISTPKRPVPLEHYLWANKGMHKIVNADKKFLEKGWKDANEGLSGKEKIKVIPTTDAPINQRDGGNQRGARGQNQRGGPQRGGPQHRGRGTPQRGRGNIARTGRGGGRTTAAQDRNIWVHLVQHLRKEDLLPACIFVFSKRRCEENADALSNLDFCTALEKSATHMIIERSIARLKLEDRALPQIRRLRELLSRGIAVHHGGLLPIVKEMVEILFAKTLVKVLFATETFAMGLNLPTRTVVFSGFRKHDGRSFRDLLPGEYTQMAGRAGRRGIDPVGSVIIVAPGSDEAPPIATLRQMILGDPTKLRSQFRLTYNMILNLLRVEALKIEEMIKRSFSEHATQTLLPEHEKQVKLSEADLAKVKRESCSICDTDLDACHQASMDFRSLTMDLHLGLLASPVGRRMIAPKRLIVFRQDGIRTAGVLLRDGVSKGLAPTVLVLEIGSSSAKRQASDLLPYLPEFRRLFTRLPNKASEMKLRAASIPLSNVECVTRTVIKIDLPSVVRKDKEAVKFAEEELVKLCSSWDTPDWDELDWARVKDLQLRNILDERKDVALAAEQCTCIQCPTFLRHFAMEHDQWLIKENISQLRQLMSDQNLQLLPDYEQRISVLKDLGFVDENSRVQLKGKVACEIHSADELVLTELILENVLADFEPAEIVALLSAFVFQEKTDISPTLTPSLERGKETIISISEKVNAFQTQHQVILSSDDSNDFVSRPRFGMVEVVYEWARGMSFNRIMDLTDVLEGTIVRVITRLDETCREVKNAARIIGDPTLFLKMQESQEMIKRDITAVASLYM